MRCAVAAGLFAGLLLSRPLWLSARLYPFTPVWRALVSPRHPFDYMLYGTLLLLVAMIPLARRPRAWIAAALAVGALLAGFDQSRLQPWFYEYLFLLAALSRRDPDTCRFILASTYFWSGMQKLNPYFAEDVFGWMLTPVAAILPAWVMRVGYAVPVVEAALGAALLVPRLRRAAVLGLIGMHALILVAIGPAGQGHNTVVWPWNVAMPVCLVLLFWPRDGAGFRFAHVHAIVLLLFGVAPLFSFFGLWDNYLAASLYSGNRATATISMKPAATQRLPAAVRRYVTPGDAGEDDELDVEDWSFGELNVPPYPEVRVYRNALREVCRFGEATMEIEPKWLPFRRTAELTLACRDVTP